MSKSFFIDKTPPIPPPYCDIALILRTINLIFTRTQIPRCPTLGSFHEKFTRKIGLKTLLLTTIKPQLQYVYQWQSLGAKNIKKCKLSHDKKLFLLYFVYQHICNTLLASFPLHHLLDFFMADLGQTKDLVPLNGKQHFMKRQTLLVKTTL